MFTFRHVEASSDRWTVTVATNVPLIETLKLPTILIGSEKVFWAAADTEVLGMIFPLRNYGVTEDRADD